MYVVFDIGGTKMRVAGSYDLDSLTTPEILLTPENFDEGMDKLIETIKKVSKGERIKKIAGGIAGPVDKNLGGIVHGTNLPNWVGQSITKRLATEFGCDVILENDTAVVGLGEVFVGAGRGRSIVAYITVSTGVGGVRIVNKEIDERSLGFEPGHQIIDMKAVFEGADDTVGHLDDYISGRAFEKRFKKPPFEVKDLEIWRETAKIFAVGLYNTILHWSPELIVVGGSMMKVPGIKIEEVKGELERLGSVFPTWPEIKKAQLGDLGGLHGALTLISD